MVWFSRAALAPVFASARGFGLGRLRGPTLRPGNGRRASRRGEPELRGGGAPRGGAGLPGASGPRPRGPLDPLPGGGGGLPRPRGFPGRWRGGGFRRRGWRARPSSGCASPREASGRRRSASSWNAPPRGRESSWRPRPTGSGPSGPPSPGRRPASRASSPPPAPAARTCGSPWRRPSSGWTRGSSWGTPPWASLASRCPWRRPASTSTGGRAWRAPSFSPPRKRKGSP